MDRHARRLVDHDQVGVLVEHREGDVLGLRLGRLGRGDQQLVVAGLGLGGEIGQDLAVAADPTLGHQGLDAAARQAWRVLGQDLVQPPARRVATPSTSWYVA